MSGGTIDHDSEPLDLAAEATAGNARLLRVRLQHWLQRSGAPEAVLDDLGLAVYEALANAVEHAYQPGHPHPVMRLQAQLQHDEVLIIVSDHGCWRSPGKPGYRGRGLAVMRRFVTEVDIRPTANGTTVRLRAPLTCIDGSGAPAERRSARTCDES